MKSSTKLGGIFLASNSACRDRLCRDLKSVGILCKEIRKVGIGHFTRMSLRDIGCTCRMCAGTANILGDISGTDASRCGDSSRPCTGCI